MDIGLLFWPAVVAAAGGLAAVVFVALRLRKRRRAGGARIEPDNRIAVLESATIDETRKLVLVRCDNVEHLIMTGGPADLVVQNDVKKDRPATAPSAAVAPAVLPAAKPAAAKQPTPRPAAEQQRGNGAARRQGDAPQAEAQAVTPTRAEARRPQAPAVEPPMRSAPEPRPALSAVPAPAAQPAGRNGKGPGAPQPGPSAARRPEPQLQRREPNAPIARAQSAPPASNPPEGTSRAQQQGERRTQPARETHAGGRAASLPAAEVPWPDGDSLENEIVRALRVESHPQGPQAVASRQETPPQRSASGSATTLGDLAERLEEALAREVQAANQGRGRLELGLDAYVSEPPPERTPERALTTAKERSEPRRAEARDRPEPRVVAPAAEAEPRREARAAAERQDEAPVINLNARRREAVDPLEDEMARLLGELTGDTGRR